MSGRLNVDGRVSVIMGTYNGAEYVVEAVTSILNQTYHDMELIVVDDGSTDNTVELVLECYNQFTRVPRFSIYHTNGPNHFTPMGGLWSYIVGAGNSTGEFLSFHSQDDLSHPDRFTKLVDAIGDRSLAHSLVQHIDGGGNPLQMRGVDMNEVCRSSIYSEDPAPDSLPHILFSSSLFRKDLFWMRECYLIGQYNYEKLITMKMFDSGGFTFLPEALYSYREHTGQVSRLGSRWDDMVQDIGYEVSDFDIHSGRYNYGYMTPMEIRVEARDRLEDGV